MRDRRGGDRELLARLQGDATQESEQGIRVVGLADVMVEARQLGEHLVRRFVPGGDCNENGPSRSVAIGAAKIPHKFVATSVRQVDVDEDDVGVEVAEAVPHCFRASHGACFVTIGTKQHEQAQGGVPVVLDDQHTQLPRSSGRTKSRFWI